MEAVGLMSQVNQLAQGVVRTKIENTGLEREIDAHPSRSDDVIKGVDPDDAASSSGHGMTLSGELMIVSL